MTPSKAPLRFLGTWKLTKCESSRPEIPHPSSGITTFTQEKDAIHYNSTTVWSDGRATDVNARINLDGSWSPVTGSLLADALSFQRLGDGGCEVKMKRAGADAGMNRTTVSADGRTLTGHWDVTGPGGEKITWTTIAARQ